MKKFLLAIAIFVSMASYSQVIRTKAIITKPDTCMNGVDYTTNIYLTLDNYSLNTRTLETTVTISIYNTARARNLGQGNPSVITAGFPMFIWNKAEQETALISKLAQIFNVPISAVALQN